MRHNPPDKREKFIREIYRVVKEKIIIAELTEVGFKMESILANLLGSYHADIGQV